MFVVDSTLLTDVYLDMKEKVPSMSSVVPIQQEMLQRAKDKGRICISYIGLPSQDAINDFMNQPDYMNIPSLCELSTDDVDRVNSMVWAPRWTQGTQNELVALMHSQGRIAWTWTLDNVNWIQEFINDGNFERHTYQLSVCGWLLSLYPGELSMKRTVIISLLWPVCNLDCYSPA